MCLAPESRSRLCRHGKAVRTVRGIESRAPKCHLPKTQLCLLSYPTVICRAWAAVPSTELRARPQVAPCICPCEVGGQSASHGALDLRLACMSITYRCHSLLLLPNLVTRSPNATGHLPMRRAACRHRHAVGRPRGDPGALSVSRGVAGCFGRPRENKDRSPRLMVPRRATPSST